jgi:hypothetical protein
LGGLSLFLLAFAVALLFFVLIPGVGAFSVRSQWRVFRQRVQECSLYTILRYADLAAADGERGCFRVLGELEAFQGRNRVWLNTGSFTVEADLSGVKLYLLPSLIPGKEREEALPDEEPAVAPWDRIFSLPSGMKLFVGGRLFLEGGRGVFRSQPREPLLVVFYDGEPRSILARAIWGGRQRNEYWNQFTLASLLTGFFCLALLAYIALRGSPNMLPGLPGLVALSLALAPVAPFLPPGVALYFLYRFFWKKARRLRAERDLLRLPLRHFLAGQASGWERRVLRLPLRQISTDLASGGERSVQLATGETYLMSSNPNLTVRGEPVVRSCSVRGKRYGPACLFGALDPGGGPDGRLLRAPEDPLAEMVRLPGDPVELAGSCDRSAHVLELAAAACFGLGTGANLFLILLLLRLVLR